MSSLRVLIVAEHASTRLGGEAILPLVEELAGAGTSLLIEKPLAEPVA